MNLRKTWYGPGSKWVTPKSQPAQTTLKLGEGWGLTVWGFTLSENLNPLNPKTSARFASSKLVPWAELWTSSASSITLEPRVQLYKRLWALNTSPPRNRLTFLRSSWTFAKRLCKHSLWDKTSSVRLTASVSSWSVAAFAVRRLKVQDFISHNIFTN